MEEQLTPVSACREEGGCEEGGCEEGGVEREVGGAPKSGDSSSAGGSIRHLGKDFQDAFISF